LLFYIPSQQTLAVHALNTDCLVASNGICTKRNTAQFGLLLFEYACEKNNIMNMQKNEMANFSFG